MIRYEIKTGPFHGARTVSRHRLEYRAIERFAKLQSQPNDCECGGCYRLVEIEDGREVGHLYPAGLTHEGEDFWVWSHR